MFSSHFFLVAVFTLWNKLRTLDPLVPVEVLYLGLKPNCLFLPTTPGTSQHQHSASDLQLLTL